MTQSSAVGLSIIVAVLIFVAVRLAMEIGGNKH